MKLQNPIRLFALLFVIAASAANSRADMLAHWTFDEIGGLVNLGTTGSASDLVAATPTGVVTGGPSFVSSGGAAGGYANFNGLQALIGDQVGNAAEFIDGYPYTLSAWVRAAATQVDRGAVVGLINRNAADQYMSMGTRNNAEGNDFQAVRRNVTFVQTDAPGTKATLIDGGWHHIAAVYIGTNALRIYLDGNLVNQASSPTVVFPTGINTIGIGAQRRSAGFIDRFTGDIDDVQIYNNALVPSQIQWLEDNPGIGAVAPILPCDVDGLNGCTMADLQIIADNFFENVPSYGDGDLNQDGIVDFADFRLWKNGPLSGEAAALYGVPEPAALPLLMLAIPLLHWLRVRTRTL